VKYTKKQNYPEHDLEEIFAEVFPVGYTTDRKEFEKHLASPESNQCKVEELG